MQKRGLFVLLLVALTLFILACTERSLYGEALKVPTTSLGNQQEQVQREAIQRFGFGTQVTLDSQGKPALVLGKLAIKTKKVATITEKTLPSATADFLAKNKRFLRISPQDLKLVRQWCDKPFYPGKKEGICSIFYQQYYRGILVYQSLVGITTNDGNAVLVQNKYYSGISVPITPTLRQAKAIEIAQQHLEVTTQPQHVSLVIYPEEQEEKIRFYLAYQIDLPPVWKGLVNITEPDQNVPAALTYFIDAHTGNVIAYHNRIRAEVEGTVQGMIFPNHRLQEKESRLFAHEMVIAGTVEAVTDDTGTYSAATAPDTAVGITTQATGPFASVVNRYQELSRYTAQGWSPSIHNIDWRNHDLSYEQEESNAFYHANIIHDFFTKGDPFDIREMDYPIEVAVEQGRAHGAQCNAYSWCDPWSQGTGRSGIAFFGPGDKCDSIALSADVVYHEYTHSVVCNMYPGGLFPYWDESGGLNEGLADYFGATIPGDSCMSDYFFREEFIEEIRASWPDDPLVKLWPCLRNLDNDKTYPNDYNPEPHDASEVFSASLWDLRESLGAPLADELVIRTMKLLPFRFKEFLDGMLVIDDDNANLNDGTPHSGEICQAFAQHGLSTRSCSGQLAEPLIQLVKPEEGSVTLGKNRLTIYGTALAERGTAFQSYAVEYAPYGTEDWSSAGITLTLSGAHPAAYNEPIATINLDAAGFQGKYVLRLRATDSNGITEEVRQNVLIFKNGWPSFQDRWINGNQILVTDLEGDGSSETIITDHSAIWPTAFNLQVAYNAEGEAVIGFISSQYEQQHLSAADIDNDGIVEFVSQAWEWTFGQNKLLIFDPYEEYWRDEGGIPFFIFRTRVELEDAGKEGCRPTLADLDGDGMMEIAMRTRNKIWLFRQDGSLVDGWPKGTLPSSSYCIDGNSLMAVADLDADGVEDLIVAEEMV
ncbi:MAG TPA: FG-GAP-like repeat-containing protein, partial [Candidatus Nanoarchaeia archaeon]|nr:FG-GAP-like repeat-containing protein [Candidatus Nanoarchaeia archaeon]